MVEQIVIQFGDRKLKGKTDRSLWQARAQPGYGFGTLPVQLLGSDSVEDIPLEGVKAVFFVKSFEGKSHDDLRFHDHLPHIECLWVRVTFHDDEVIEGLIQNSCHFVLQEGFFISPIDPEGNNWLIYASKSQLKEFHVLGLRPAPKSFSEFAHPINS